MVTLLMNDRSSLRQLAAAMALVMVMASLPSIGVIMISDRSGPSISMDICHPLPSLDNSPNIVPLARPAPPGARHANSFARDAFSIRSNSEM